MTESDDEVMSRSVPCSGWETPRPGRRGEEDLRGMPEDGKPNAWGGYRHRFLACAVPCWLLLVLAAGSGSGCGSSGDEGAVPVGGAESAAAVQAEQARLAEEVRRVLAELPAAVDRYLAGVEPFAAHVEQELARSGKGLRAAKLLALAYVERKDGARFAGPGGVLPAGTKLLESIAGAGEHGLDPARFTPAGLEERSAELTRAEQALAALPELAVPAGAERVLEEAAARAGIPADSVGPGSALEAALVGLLADEASPWPALRLALAERRKAFAARQQALAALELTLADSFVAWARQMKDGHVRRELDEQERSKAAYERAQEKRKGTPAPRRAEPENSEAAGEPTAEEPGPSAPSGPPVMRSAAEIVRDKLLATLARVTDGESAAQVLAGLVPRHPQYTGLQAELQRYRGIAAAGGWKKVNGRNTSLRWLPATLVETLKERLATEGYYTGEVDRKLDAGLREAVQHYQRTHQMTVEPELRPIFWSSLNVPVEERVARLELTLQRWRESTIADDPCYVFVNIADFTAEVWADGKRLFRTNVVVGNRDTRCDEKKKELVLGYATPLLSARITYLVFAPTWKVPPKIKREELDLEREKDPLYYQKEGFAILDPGGPNEAVKQLPGPKNSLGFVKFVFPNRHAVFMHDTPAKGLFALPIRTFSHGCMRLEDPLGLARTVLTLDGQWNEEKYAELFEKWKEIDFSPLRQKYDDKLYAELAAQAAKLETGVVLRQPIPVHIEYYTVRIDDEGRANFLADPYGYDQQALHPKKPKTCTPDSEKAVDAFAGTLAELERVDARLQGQAAHGERLIAEARGLDAAVAGKKLARTLELARELEETLRQARTLAGQARALHAELREEQGQRGKEGWDRKRTARALKLKRMMDELGKMDKRLEKRTDALRARLAPPPDPVAKEAEVSGKPGAGAALPAPGPPPAASADAASAVAPAAPVAATPAAAPGAAPVATPPAAGPAAAPASPAGAAPPDQTSPSPPPAPGSPSSPARGAEP